MDPLAHTDDINAGWSSPTTNLRFDAASAAEDTAPTSATSNPYAERNVSASENANGFGAHNSTGLGSGIVGGDIGAGYREPVVFGAPGMGLVSPPPESAFQQSQQETPGGAVQQERKAPRVYLRVRIGTLERNKKDLLIRFDASTNLSTYKNGMYRNMQRSYVEFQRFAEQLSLVCPQTIIPALPLPSTSASTDEEDDRLVRIALQRWFSRVCEDPVLMRQDEVRSFIESNFGYSPIPPPTAKRSQTNVLSALTKVVRRGPLDEDDELSSAKIALDKLEERYGHAATCVSHVGKARRQLANSNAELGAKMVSLSTVESEPSLAGAERKLGRAWEQVSGMINAQAANENVILSDTLGYQALNARAAKDTLVQRTAVLEDSQSASKAAITKRRNLERLKASSNINPAKVDDAISEMQEADSLEQSLSHRVTAISQNLHHSLRAHSRHAHEDIAISLMEAARMSAIYHKQALRELESLRADIGKVAPGAAPLDGLAISGKSPVASRVQPTQPSLVSSPPPPQSQYASPYAAQPPLTAQVGRQPPMARTSQSQVQPQPQAQPQVQPPIQPQAQTTFHPQPQAYPRNPYATQPPPSQSAAPPFPPQSQSQSSSYPIQPPGSSSQSPYGLAPNAAGPSTSSQFPPRIPTSPPTTGFPVADGTQSMFLPSGGNGGMQRSHSAAPDAPGFAGAPRMVDPLAGYPRGPAAPGMQGMQGMGQSMFVPSQSQSQASFRTHPAQPLTPNAGPGPASQAYQPQFQPPQPPYQPAQLGQGYPVQNVSGYPGQQQPQQISPFPGPAGVQRAATIATGRRKLDERKAAKMLAGGF
ncbi:vacuolar protein sorting-associated protein vps17 [Cryptococcus neoformans A2-102-5]|nr:vacuolar protein sorting-associated protein vps17 [Cryptococcus neoformans var. grubii D17-1]OXG99403.1 vacuolar protein sorting-associated protein vps17 [Cryptococcus neoformans var. grubii A2-102-5]